jgi:LPXTG-motif cell wall-anchored protein
MAGTPGYDFSNKVTTGPVDFGSTFSGGGTVVFGTSSPGVTAAVTNLTSNPWLLAVAGVVALAGLYLYLRTKRK